MPRYDTSARIAIMTGLAVAGPVGFLISPVIVGMLAAQFDWSEAQLGTVASAELAGMAVAAFTALLWAKKAPWKPIFLVCLVGLIGGNLLSMRIADFMPLAVLRFVLGLLGGAMMAIYITFLSYTREPDRNASILVFCQVSFQVASFILIPIIGAQYGLAGLFVFIAALYLPFLIFFNVLPSSAPRMEATQEAIAAHQPDTPGLRGLWPPISILIASGLFFITQVGVFAFFLTHVGPHQNVDAAQAEQVLTWSTAFALAGPVASYFIRERFDRRFLLVLPALGQAVLLYFMAQGELSFTEFFVFASLFQTLWNFMLAYILAALVDADKTHRLVALLPTAQAIGIAAGPVLIGSYLEQYGIWAIAGIGALAITLFAAFIAPYAKQIAE